MACFKASCHQFLTLRHHHIDDETDCYTNDEQSICMCCNYNTVARFLLVRDK